MTQEKQQTKPGMFESKHWKAVLTIIAGLLTFGAPYVVYIMVHPLKLGFFVSMGAGGIVFLIGLVFIWYLIKKKIIS